MIIKFLFPIVLFIGMFIFFLRYRESKALFAVLLFGFAFRLLFSVLNVIGFSFPMASTSDIVRFLDHAKAGSESVLYFDVSQSYVWASIVGLIYKFTGDIVYSPLFINSFFGTITILVVYNMSFIASGCEKKSLRSAVIVCFLPPLIFTSATYLREAAVTLFVTMFFYSILRYADSRYGKLSSAIYLIVSGVLAAIFHGAFILLPIIGTFFILLYSFIENKTFSSIFRNIFLYSFVLLILIVSFNYQVGAAKVSFLYEFSFEGIDNKIRYLASHGVVSEYLWLIEFSTIFFVFLTILKFIYMPFFSDEIRLFDIVRYPIVVYMSALILLIACRICPPPFSHFKLSYGVIFTTLLIFFIGFGLSSADPDTAFRHYIKFFPAIVALGIWCKARKGLMVP